MSDFDLIVLGGGSGGLAAAFRAAQHGARVAMLEPGPLGGTCVNVGCVPKKAMWLAAHLAGRVEFASRVGFDVKPVCPDWMELITHRQRYIEGIHVSYRKRLLEAGVTTLPLRGRLVDAQTVECEDGVRLSAPHILLATGGRPRRPDIPGCELGIDSDGFFDLRSRPKRVALVGGGYISVELAGILQALGSDVEVFAQRSRLLKTFDHDITDMLAENCRQAGIKLHFDIDIARAEAVAAESIVLHDADGQRSEAFDCLIWATGRRSNSDDLGLDRAGVAIDAQGHVTVDDFQRTNVDGICAIGDVTGRIALTPVAIAAGRRLMERLFGGQPDAKLDYDLIPTVVFAQSPLGHLGMTEAEAREAHGDDVHVYRSNFRPMLCALADSPMRSLFKLVCVGDDERVVGVHLIGEGADEILQGFAIALKMGARKCDFDSTVAIHPSSAEELVLMR